MIYQLAPMESVTAWAFRALCSWLGADRTYTEMIRAKALAKDNRASWELIDTFGEENCHVQLMAVKPREIDGYFEVLEEKKEPHFANINGYNLNLGCPSPDVIRQGGGAALTKRAQRVCDLLTALSEHTDVPLSIKIRLGLNNYEMQNGVHLNLLDALASLELKNFNEVIVHLKHGREKSADKVRYDAIPALRKHCKQQLTLNGGYNATHLPSDVYGVMFARAAVGDPCIFSQIKNMRTTTEQAQQYFSQLTKQHPLRDKYKAYLKKYSTLS